MSLHAVQRLEEARDRHLSRLLGAGLPAADSGPPNPPNCPADPGSRPSPPPLQPRAPARHGTGSAPAGFGPRARISGARVPAASAGSPLALRGGAPWASLIPCRVDRPRGVLLRDKLDAGDRGGAPAVPQLRVSARSTYTCWNQSNPNTQSLF